MMSTYPIVGTEVDALLRIKILLPTQFALSKYAYFETKFAHAWIQAFRFHASTGSPMY